MAYVTLIAAIGVSAKRGAASLSAGPSAFPSSYVARAFVIADHPRNASVPEGFAFDGSGTLYESGFPAALRSVDIATDATLAAASDADMKYYFGTFSAFNIDFPHLSPMGIVVLGDRLYVQQFDGLSMGEYSVPDLKLLRRVSMADKRLGPNGFGLAKTADEERLLVADGTASLLHVRPDDYSVTLNVTVRDPQLDPLPGTGVSGRRIHEIAYMQLVKDELWGIIYPLNDNPSCMVGKCSGAYSGCIVRIDPTSGIVKGWIDARSLTAQQFTPAELAALRPQSEYATDPVNHLLKPAIYPNNKIMSALAYDAASGRLVVSGKLWEHTYEIGIEAAPELGADFVSSSCGLSSLA